jgi:hypothetical protein
VHSSKKYYTTIKYKATKEAADQYGLKQSQEKEFIVKEKPRWMRSYIHVVTVFPQKKKDKQGLMYMRSRKGMSNIVTPQGNEAKTNTGI